MKKWFSLFVILAAALIQATLLDHFKIFGAKPDLLLIIMVTLAGIFLFQLRWLIILAAIAGIFKDIFSVNTFGVNTLLFCCWVVLIVRASKKMSIDDNLRRAILILIIAVLHSIATGIIALLLGNPVPLGIFLRVTFFGALYTLLITPLIFKVLARWLKS